MTTHEFLRSRRRVALVTLVGAFAALVLAGIGVLSQPALWAILSLGLILTGVVAVRCLILLEAMRADTETRTSLKQLESTVFLAQALGLQAPLPPMRDSVLSPDAACILVREILIRKPKVVVELGSGVSTTIVAQALLLAGGEGRLISIDHERTYFEQTYQLLRACGLEDRVSLLHSPLTERAVGGARSRWYDIDIETLPEKIDLLIVDGPPAVVEPLARYAAMPLLFPRLSTHGTVFVDDYDRPGDTEVVRRWLNEFPDLRLSAIKTEKGTALLTFASPETLGQGD